MVAPTTFSMPSLGRLVALGELFDANSGEFLGVQLYTPDSVKRALLRTKRDPPDTVLKVSYSTTFQEKSSVIDVDASLSLDILSGLLSVSGSASYLKDTKSNTSQDCFAMTLAMRGREERIEVGNKDLVALSDNLKGSYVAATHFVSAIQYGGNAVISMVEVVENLTDDEKITGNMKITLSQLAGKVKLTGKVDVDAEKEYTKLNNKFDIQMYGDFTIADVPVNAKDVLAALNQVYASIKDAGVPIKITLQPIPTSLRSTVTQVHALTESAVTELLTAYSRVDDLHNRFVVLENSVMRCKDIIPHLVDAVVTAFKTFTETRVELLEKLRTFLLDTSDTKDDTTVLKGAQDLYAAHKHKHSDDKINPPDYPKSLGGLEKAFSKFAGLNLILKSNRVSFSSYDYMSLYLPQTNQAMLFLVWSLSATAKAKYSGLLKEGYAKDYKKNYLCYFAYSEKVSEIDDTSLPKGSQISTSDTAGYALFRYTVKDATPKWAKVEYNDMTTDATNNASFDQESSKIYTLPLAKSGRVTANDITSNTGSSSTYRELTNEFGFDPDKSFTLIVTAEATSLGSGKMLFFLGDYFDSNPQFYCAIKSDKTIDFQIYNTEKKSFYSFTSSSVTVDAYNRFVIAFVQDKDNSKWLLYVNGEEKATCSMHANYKFRKNFDFKVYRFVVSRAISESSYGYWDGMVYKFEGHEGALKKESVQNRSYKLI